MPDLASLSGPEREFYTSRKEYLNQIEITRRLLNAERGIDLETAKWQWNQELRALHRYQEARSAFQESLGGVDHRRNEGNAAPLVCGWAEGQRPPEPPRIFVMNRYTEPGKVFPELK
jgi:hypothetical protein